MNESLGKEVIKKLSLVYQVFYELCREAGIEIEETGEKNDNETVLQKRSS